MFNLEKLKICFIAGTLSQGGAERQLYYMLKSLSMSNIDVRLLCLTRGDYWEDKILKIGVPITWVGRSPFKFLRLIEIVNTLRKTKPDIIQSQHFYTNLYAVAASKMLGRHEIGAIRNDVISEVAANGPLFGPLSLRCPKALAANSRMGIHNAIRAGVSPKKLHFLPNVIDCQKFSPESRNDRDTITILSAGRLVKQKRFDRFLKILSVLHKNKKFNVKGIIVGDGPLKHNLRELAQRLNLPSDVIRFTGVVSDMTDLYRQADIFLLTSDWEGTPNVVLEAMSSGLPVVASKVGGVTDIIRNGETGILIDDLQFDNYLTALIELIQNKPFRYDIAKNARRFIAENHSIEFLCQYLGGLYEAILFEKI